MGVKKDFGLTRIQSLDASSAISARVSPFVLKSERLPTHSRVVWEIWTNGLYKSTLHRVVHRGTNYRYVLPSWNNCFVVLIPSQCLVRF